MPDPSTVIERDLFGRWYGHLREHHEVPAVDLSRCRRVAALILLHDERFPGCGFHVVQQRGRGWGRQRAAELMLAPGDLGAKLLGYVERTGQGWIAHRGSAARNRVQIEGVFTSREKAAEALR